MRIALLYGALSGVAVALVAIAAYLSHRRTQLDVVDSALRRSAQHVVLQLATARTAPDSDALLAGSLVVGASIRVFDINGAIIGQSTNRASVPPLRVCDVRSTANEHCLTIRRTGDAASTRAAAYQVVRDSLGIRWRVYVLDIANGKRFINGTPFIDGTRFIAAMLPLSDIEVSVAAFARRMLVIAIGGSIVTGFLGWMLARRALRPVAVLTAGAMAQSRAFSRRASDEKDHDELDRLAATFNEMLAVQHRANEAQQRFTAAASHELRAPLSIISANLELLANGRVTLTADRNEAIAEARDQAKRMARLVKNLLVLARADAGVPLAPQAVELDRVLLEVVGELRHIVKGQRLEIKRFQPVVVQGEADRIKQLVLILIDNAIKYTAANQHVTIELTQEPTTAVLSVRDTGVGMSSADLARAFERFYRADGARAIDAGGTGLGLPIARLIAEELGGTVELTSELGQGTTATVRIPIAGRATK